MRVLLLLAAFAVQSVPGYHVSPGVALGMTICRRTTPPHAPTTVCGYFDYLARYKRDPPRDVRDFARRYNAYRSNMEYIDARNEDLRNEGQPTYKLGVNAFTDTSREDFAAWRLRGLGGSRLTPAPTPRSERGPWAKPAGLPTAVDWRADGWVVPVKDQGQCGSCWAFSAIGAIEGQHANVTGKLVSLSEQNLVDCAGAFGCDGCEGGWPEAAMRYVESNGGVDREVSYPYGGTDGACAYGKNTSGSTVSRTVNVTSGDMGALYTAIATVGPISVAIDAESDFQFYVAGIFRSPTCSSEFLDHAVLAVGYGETETGARYIVVKNSWGAGWGMDGYIYMSADPPNMCGIATAASYPVVAGN